LALLGELRTIFHSHFEKFALDYTTHKEKYKNQLSKNDIIDVDNGEENDQKPVCNSFFKKYSNQVIQKREISLVFFHINLIVTCNRKRKK
jgi:hypothetical protein